MEDKGIHEFVCVCLLERNIDGNMITVSFCNIYPVLYEGHYTYMTFSFEYDNRKNLKFRCSDLYFSRLQKYIKSLRFIDKYIE